MSGKHLGVRVDSQQQSSWDGVTAFAVPVSLIAWHNYHAAK